MGRRLERLRPWLIRKIPVAVLAHPAEFFLAFLSGLSGIPYMLGVARSTSLSVLLPDLFVRGFGAALTFGAFALVCGLTSIRYEHGLEIVGRLACYKLGLRLFIAAGLSYGIGLVVVAGLNAVAAVAAVFMFVGYCMIRLLALSAAEDRGRQR